MAVRVLLQAVQPAMRLARPILDADGHLVAGAGTQLRESVVRALRKLALQSVLVVGGGDVPSWDTVRPLADELADLDARLATTARAGALGELHAAIVRHLRARAAHMAAASGEGPGDAEPGSRG